jgi:hypothetical protein
LAFAFGCQANSTALPHFLQTGVTTKQQMPTTTLSILADGGVAPGRDSEQDDRATTPYLAARAATGELDVFDDTAAPAVYTLNVLRLALNFSDSQHPELLLERPSLDRPAGNARIRWICTGRWTGLFLPRT